MNHIYALLTLVFCVAIFWACICRLRLLTPQHPFSSILRYAVLIMAAIAYGMAPVLFNEWPGAAGTVFSGCVFLAMLLNLKQGHCEGA